MTLKLSYDKHKYLCNHFGSRKCLKFCSIVLVLLFSVFLFQSSYFRIGTIPWKKYIARIDFKRIKLQPGPDRTPKTTRFLHKNSGMVYEAIQVRNNYDRNTLLVYEENNNTDQPKDRILEYLHKENVKPTVNPTKPVQLVTFQYNQSSQPDSDVSVTRKTEMDTSIDANFTSEEPYGEPGVYLAPQGEKTQRRFPQCVIVGFPKCGTRAILEALCRHPYVRCHHREAHFYDTINFDLGYDWYKELMPKSFSNQITAEKTPAYVTSSRARSEMKVHFPKVKIIVLVRDPIERVLSAHAQQVYKETRDGYEKGIRSKPLSEFFSNSKGEIDANKRSVNLSLYSEHLKEWYKIFPSSQILVVDGKDFVSQPLKAMKKVEIFLDIPRLYSSQNFVPSNSTQFYCFRGFFSRNIMPKCMSDTKGRQHYNLTVEEEKKLQRFFQPYNEELFKLVGQRFDWTKHFHPS